MWKKRLAPDLWLGCDVPTGGAGAGSPAVVIGEDSSGESICWLVKPRYGLYRDTGSSTAGDSG
jgi:hypothetical protein